MGRLLQHNTRAKNNSKEPIEVGLGFSLLLHLEGFENWITVSLFYSERLSGCDSEDTMFNYKAPNMCVCVCVHVYVCSCVCMFNNIGEVLKL